MPPRTIQRSARCSHQTTFGHPGLRLFGAAGRSWRRPSPAPPAFRASGASCTLWPSLAALGSGNATLTKRARGRGPLPDVRFGHPGLHSLVPACASASCLRLPGNAGSNPRPQAAAASPPRIPACGGIKRACLTGFVTAATSIERIQICCAVPTPFPDGGPGLSLCSLGGGIKTRPDTPDAF